jgi:hypothetical protein
MNRKLTDAQISAAFDSLQRSGAGVSVRAVRAALRAQYGVAGKTARLSALCRQLRAPVLVNQPEVFELRRQVLLAEQALSAAHRERDAVIGRAERSEARELAHQDRWAGEIHRLREAVEQLKGERTRRQALEEQVLRLQRELQALRQPPARDEQGA